MGEITGLGDDPSVSLLYFEYWKIRVKVTATSKEQTCGYAPYTRQPTARIFPQEFIFFLVSSPCASDFSSCQNYTFKSTHN
jgi:hypothetical protein